MAGTVYRPDHSGVSGLLNSPEMSAAMLAVASEGVSYAQSISPRESGRYAASFYALPLTVKAGFLGGPRAGAMIVNVSPYAAAVEWRNGAHVLAKTATHIDGRAHGSSGSNARRVTQAQRARLQRSQLWEPRKKRKRRRPSQG